MGYGGMGGNGESGGVPRGAKAVGQAHAMWRLIRRVCIAFCTRRCLRNKISLSISPPFRLSYRSRVCVSLPTVVNLPRLRHQAHATDAERVMEVRFSFANLRNIIPISYTATHSPEICVQQHHTPLLARLPITASLPRVHHLQPLPGASSLSFSVDECTSFTALHCCTETLSFSGKQCEVIRSCEEYDVALIQHLRCNSSSAPRIQWCDVSPSDTLYATDNRIRLSMHAVKYDHFVLSWSGARCVMLLLEANNCVTPGWSGAPVMNAHGEVVAMIVEACDRFVLAVPWRVLKLVLTHVGDSKVGSLNRQKRNQFRKNGASIKSINGHRVRKNAILWGSMPVPLDGGVLESADKTVNVTLQRKGTKIIQTIHVDSAKRGCQLHGRRSEVVLKRGGWIFEALSIELAEQYGDWREIARKLGWNEDEDEEDSSCESNDERVEEIVVARRDDASGESSQGVKEAPLPWKRVRTVRGQTVRRLSDVLHGGIIQMDN